MRESLRKREFERQIMRDKAEDERKDSRPTVAKGKLFGDAMHASAIHGADPIELICFLRNCEQLFAVYDVGPTRFVTGYSDTTTILRVTFHLKLDYLLMTVFCTEL